MLHALNEFFAIFDSKPDKKMTHSRNTGFAPMAKVDGSKIRKLREEKGLTQLYLATTVEVTTDTISRWENRRYPTIKKENALNLAQALEVTLEEILLEDKPELKVEAEAGEEKEEKEQKESLPEETSKEPVLAKKDQKKKQNILFYPACLAILACIVLAVLKTGSFFERTTISATRFLPKQTPVNRSFPVIIRIKTNSEQNLPIILRESLPQSCIPISGSPPFTAVDQKTREIKWIKKTTGNNESIFLYLVKVTATVSKGSSLKFSGSAILRIGNNISTPIKGHDTVTISSHHWADSNLDNKIDDEEILYVYEQFEQIAELEDEINEIEDIWSGNGYSWNDEQQQFTIFGKYIDGF
jgi:transcriptional regulator with XRE-family HTH domain